MKLKILLIVLTVGLLLTSGCSRSGNISDMSNQSSTSSSVEAARTSAMVTDTGAGAPNTSTSNTGANSVSTSSQQADTGSEPINNPFFFDGGVKNVEYKACFLFDTIIEQDVNVSINELESLDLGKLYEIKISSIEGVPEDRLNLGYFYVQKDKIYKIEPTKENLDKLMAGEDLPEGSAIFCQDTEIKDILAKDEIGFHQSLKVNGDIREFHSYNNELDTGYYESFTWEKGKGLIKYRSGFGAERDSIDIEVK